VVAGKPVTLRRGVPVVQVGGDGVEAEATVVRGQVVVVTDQDRRPVLGHEGRPGRDAVESPQTLVGKVAGHHDVGGDLVDLVDLGGGEGEPAVGADGRLV